MDLPIGVLDSGIAGLSVVREIIKTLPNESIVYLGDTARGPYGSRDTETIKKFSKELAKSLIKKEVKVIVVACNTMSAIALSEIEKIARVPVIDVISKTVEYVAELSINRTVGVIGTRATINSKSYDKAFDQYGIKIKEKPCPLFVPLVEEGVFNGPVLDLVAHEYLDNFSVDTLILGCTHYPLIYKTIQNIVGRDTQIVDSAHPTANALLELLFEEKMISKKGNPKYNFYVTDDTEKIEEVANLFFDNNLPGKLERISL